MKELPELLGLSHNDKDELIRTLWALVVEFRSQVAILSTEVAEPRGQLAKNSQNSSKPPSLCAAV